MLPNVPKATRTYGLLHAPCGGQTASWRWLVTWSACAGTHTHTHTHTHTDNSPPQQSAASLSCRPRVPRAPSPPAIMLRLALAAAKRGVQQQQQQGLNALAACCCQQLQLAATAAGAAAAQQKSSHPLLLLAAAAPQLGARAFHACSALLSADKALASVLAKELKHEQTVHEVDDIVSRGPPAPFTLSSTPGDTAVSLTRTYKDETISVDASVNMQDSMSMPLEDEGMEGEDDGELDDDAEVAFNVSVTKGERSLVFEMVSDGSYTDIRHVSLEPAGGHDSDTAFTGPVFSELDDELQGSFRAFIEERGITEELGTYLRHLLYAKEQEEYVRWLDGVRSFVS